MTFNIHRFRNGFTLVEMLVVITIIGILLTIVIASISQAKTNSKIKAETANVEQFGLYLQLYRELYGCYPSNSTPSSFGVCSNADTHWTTYVSPGTEAAGAADWDAIATEFSNVIIPTPIFDDVWGNHYIYDTNLGLSNSKWRSYICSRGPDGIFDVNTKPNQVGVSDPIAGGDDICFFSDN